MFRRRLRPTPTAAELAVMYAVPHDHRFYGYGHELRVQATILLGRWLMADGGFRSVADLSTGNAVIPRTLAGPTGADLYLGDVAPGYRYHGPVEETIDELPPVDLFVCSETIEHLNDPDGLLERVWGRAKGLLLSTPIGEDDGSNPEHLWGWDQEAVSAMLIDAGWSDFRRVDLLLPDTYSYQIWACR